MFIKSIQYNSLNRTHKIEGLIPTFPCDMCGREFIGRNKLNEHKKTHTGEATCDLCNKVFYSVSSMKKNRDRLSCQRFIERNNVKKEVRFYYEVVGFIGTCFRLFGRL